MQDANTKIGMPTITQNPSAQNGESDGKNTFPPVLTFAAKASSTLVNVAIR